MNKTRSTFLRLTGVTVVVAVIVLKDGEELPAGLRRSERGRGLYGLANTHFIAQPVCSREAVPLLALAQYCWLGMMIVVNTCTYLDPARYVAIENAHETSLGLQVSSRGAKFGIPSDDMMVRSHSYRLH